MTLEVLVGNAFSDTLQVTNFSVVRVRISCPSCAQGASQQLAAEAGSSAWVSPFVFTCPSHQDSFRSSYGIANKTQSEGCRSGKRGNLVQLATQSLAETNDVFSFVRNDSVNYPSPSTTSTSARVTEGKCDMITYKTIQ